MNSKKSVLIIGAGEIGQAIGHVLRKSAVHPKLMLWDSDSRKGTARVPLATLVPSADFVFLCVPSLVLRQVCHEIADEVQNSAVVIALTKGIEPDGHLVDQILEEELRNAVSGVLGGPLLAEELLANLGGVGSFGSTNAKARYSVHKLFARTGIRLEFFEEPRSVALLGVLKNVYSVAIAMASSVMPGDNARGYFTAMAMKEMTIMLGKYGCEPVHVLSAAGAGDLIATSQSRHSFNAKVGRELAKGKRANSSEGTRAVPVIAKFLGSEMHQLPLFTALKLVIGGKTVKSVSQNL